MQYALDFFARSCYDCFTMCNVRYAICDMKAEGGYVMRLVLLGNIVSAFASVFLAASCLVNNKRRAYLCQAAESVFLVISSLLLSSWAGASTQLIAVYRNVEVMEDRFSRRKLLICTLLTVGIGLAVNNRGLIGLIPIAATIQLSFCNRYARSLLGTKWAFFFNALLYIIYSFLISDYAYALTLTATCIGCLISISHLHRART